MIPVKVNLSQIKTESTDNLMALRGAILYTAKNNTGVDLEASDYLNHIGVHPDKESLLEDVRIFKIVDVELKRRVHEHQAQLRGEACRREQVSHLH